MEGQKLNGVFQAIDTRAFFTSGDAGPFGDKFCNKSIEFFGDFLK
jgi:hypothetical protein